MDLTISLQVLLGPSVIVTTDPAARGGRGARDSSSHLVTVDCQYHDNPSSDNCGVETIIYDVTCHEKLYERLGL